MDWLTEIARWGWSVVVASLIWCFRISNRVSVNEARIAALESGHSKATDKIDENQKAVLESIDALRNELKADYRMIVQALLEKVPKA